MCGKGSRCLRVILRDLEKDKRGLFQKESLLHGRLRLFPAFAQLRDGRGPFTDTEKQINTLAGVDFQAQFLDDPGQCSLKLLIIQGKVIQNTENLATRAIVLNLWQRGRISSLMSVSTRRRGRSKTNCA